MESHANGHTYLHPRDRYAASANILTSITVEEVNAVAKELCEHLSHMDVSKGVMPAAVVACAPVMDRSGIFSSFLCGIAIYFLFCVLLPSDQILYCSEIDPLQFLVPFFS